MTKILKKIQTIYFCFAKINWVRFFQLYDRNAKNIIWYYPPFRKKLFLQSVERDFAFASALIELNQPFRIYFGKRIGKFANKNIFYSVTKYYDSFHFLNYTHILHHISRNLELQGNYVYPTSREALFWENKSFMHEQFNNLHISSPKTFIVSSLEDALKTEMTFPCLLKEPHSSSSMGLFKITSKEHLKETIVGQKVFERNESILLQELINIRRDIRVTLVGNEICHHYWRINLADEWKPTATGYGSRVDFENFPEAWRGWIIEQFKALNLTTGAFDVAWPDDDLTREPLILEVSPFYQPNPPVNLEGKKFNYGQYKKSLKLRESWDKKFVDVVFELQYKTVKNFLRLKGLID